ncbi:MAG: sigma-70 family RNA polymerase sigma factor, partial [Calditrichaeota bacterium]|nr:sigma-70 family RNA polymerase sigma factor [Calditrichota bacterium]
MDLLYYSGLKMTKNQADTEDLVQETLYKAYRSINQFQKDTNFRAWIFRIMMNTYITNYRKTIR